MWPAQPWGDPLRVLNRGGGTPWMVERLLRAVRRLAAEKIVDPEVLDPSPRKPAGDRLLVLAAGITSAAPHRMFQQIASQFERMASPPRGGTRWHASSVRHLLQRAERLGLLGTPSPSPGTPELTAGGYAF
jgi:hypothetical protein